MGRVSFERFSYKTVPLLQLTDYFSWDGERAMIRELRLRHESGELRGDLLDAPKDFRLTIDSAIDPTVFRAFASPELGRFLGEWEWTRPPLIRLAIHGPGCDPEFWVGDGNITTQRTRFRGGWMNEARSGIRLENGALTAADLHVIRDEGVGTGTIVYDFAHHEIRLKEIKSGLRLTDTIAWVDPKYFKEVVPYKFRQQPSLLVNGVFHFHGVPGDHIEIKVDAPSGMDYMFLGKNLPFDRVNGRLLFSDNRLQLLEMTGKLLNGDVRGGADISLAKNDNHYRANLSLDGVDFPKLADLYFKNNRPHGKLTGSYDWTGQLPVGAVIFEIEIGEFRKIDAVQAEVRPVVVVIFRQRNIGAAAHIAVQEFAGHLEQLESIVAKEETTVYAIERQILAEEHVVHPGG